MTAWWGHIQLNVQIILLSDRRKGDHRAVGFLESPLTNRVIQQNYEEKHRVTNPFVDYKCKHILTEGRQ